MNLPPIVHEVLSSSGQPLDPTTRAFMEPRFGHDFSGVRVHTGAQAAESARSVSAFAYTVDRDVVFGAGQYLPDTLSGTRLLAHELAHVVQQRGGNARSLDALVLGSPDDAYEREADTISEDVMSGHHAPSVTQVGAPRLQGSFWSTLVDVLTFPFVAIYRLLGGESYNRETLQEYLKGLRERGSIENQYDSDNKARACVSRENEIGPYDTNTKILLVREMLEGATLWGDEAAIITLLRGAQPTERQQITTAIGRDLIWKNFSGQNRRVIEAITLTAADAAGTALITRFRAMPEGELQDYVTNALDPVVRAAAQRASMLQRITAPVPVEATLSPQGTASFQINGVDIVAEPDSYSTDERYRNRAFTNLGLNVDPAADIIVDPATDVIRSYTPPHIRGTVQTIFGPGSDPSGRSGYGRGTTSEDVAASATMLRFHESQHSAAWFDFFRGNPPPVFPNMVGKLMGDFRHAEDQFAEEFKQYGQRAFEYSVRMTDCPGTPATEEQLRPFGFSATICHQR